MLKITFDCPQRHQRADQQGGVWNKTSLCHGLREQVAGFFELVAANSLPPLVQEYFRVEHDSEAITRQMKSP
jgi:hypothetical protein